MKKFLFSCICFFVISSGSAQLHIGISECANSSDVNLKLVSSEVTSIPHQERKIDVTRNTRLVSLGNFGLVVRLDLKKFNISFEPGIERSFYSYAYDSTSTYFQYSDATNLNLTSTHINHWAFNSTKSYFINPYGKVRLGFQLIPKHNIGICLKSSHLLKQQYKVSTLVRGNYGYFETNYSVFSPIIAGLYYNFSLTKAISLGFSFSKLVSALDENYKRINVFNNSKGDILGVEINFLILNKSERETP